MAKPSRILLTVTILVQFSISSGLEGTEVAALKAAKQSLMTSPFFSTWNFQNIDPCDSFAGLVCSDSGHVSTLSLGSGLSGTLSPSLGRLSGLTQLILYPGFISGLIPNELGRLRDLRVLSLTHNRLSGPIPSSIATLPHLHTLDLSFNSLSGFIPPTLFTVPSLKILVLTSNSFSGHLPPSFPSRCSILHLDLSSNRLSGELPSQFPSSMRYISVARNNLWGPLTAMNKVRDEDELEYVDLSMNLFSGFIPSSLLYHRRLSTVFLQRNRLSGELPKGRPGGALRLVDLSHNSLVGDLPPELAGVETIHLNNNKFTGSVPAEYIKSVARGSAKTILLQNNFLTRLPRMAMPNSWPDSASLCLYNNCIPPYYLHRTACPQAPFIDPRPFSQCKLVH